MISGNRTEILGLAEACPFGTHIGVSCLLLETSSLLPKLMRDLAATYCRCIPGILANHQSNLIDNGREQKLLGHFPPDHVVAVFCRLNHCVFVSLVLLGRLHTRFCILFAKETSLEPARYMHFIFTQLFCVMFLI